jgi:uncharacterized protein (TIGR03086 family)
MYRLAEPVVKVRSRKAEHMDAVETLHRTVGELNRLVDNIKPEQLDDATLCTEWKVRDLLNHLTSGATMFAISAEQGSVPDDVLGPLMTTDQLGDDYKGSVHTAATRALAAFGQPGIMEKTVQLPFGEMPAGIALNIAIFDVATHCCDLARATGQQVDDDELLAEALTKGKSFVGPQMRGGGLFDDEQSAAEGASPADRLLAFAGRHI